MSMSRAMASAPRGPKLPKVPSELEARFLQCWKAVGGMAPVTEMQFHSGRKWRFDMAWPEVQLAIEIEGGIYSGGRHTRGTGFQADCEKYLEAAILGWTVIRLTPSMLDKPTLGRIVEAFGL